jgi:general secretion pathway protein M
MVALPRLVERLNLNPREQRLASVLVVVFGAMLVLGVPLAIEGTLFARRATNDKLRTTLESVQAARAQVREQKAKKESVTQRYAKKAPALAGFLEQAARAQKLEISDSADRPEVPLGKQYTERSTIIHIKKAGMYGVAKFLEAIEKSEDAVAVTRLNIRKRTAEPDSYDVEVAVSAYDRKEQPAAPTGAASAKGAPGSGDATEKIP